MFVAFSYAAVRLMQHQRWLVFFIPITVTIILLFIWLKRYTFVPHSVFLPQLQPLARRHIAPVARPEVRAIISEQ